jgi:hypothetical protein
MLAALMGSGAAVAQEPGAAIDLGNSIFAQHASLPLNEISGAPILESLQPLVAEQMREGKGSSVYTSLIDEDTGIAPYKDLTSLFQDLTCRADLVVIGKPQKKMSHLSASRAAIYTDYDFEIDTLFRASLQSTPQQHIVITRPGGTLPVQGGSVTYSNGMLPTARSSHTYLLFLDKIAGTGAYQPSRDAASRQIFSTLELQTSGTEWRVYRNSYMNRSFPELANLTIRGTIATSSLKCKQ